MATKGAADARARGVGAGPIVIDAYAVDVRAGVTQGETDAIAANAVAASGFDEANAAADIGALVTPNKDSAESHDGTEEVADCEDREASEDELLCEDQGVGAGMPYVMQVAEAATPGVTRAAAEGVGMPVLAAGVGMTNVTQVAAAESADATQVADAHGAEAVGAVEVVERGATRRSPCLANLGPDLIEVRAKLRAKSRALESSSCNRPPRPKRGDSLIRNIQDQLSTFERAKQNLPLNLLEDSTLLNLASAVGFSIEGESSTSFLDRIWELERSSASES